MLASNPAPLWRQIQKENFTSWQKLTDFLNLNENQRERLFKAPPFSLNVPRRLVEKMRKETLNDPLLMQFLPFVEELEHSEGFTLDPVGDRASMLSSKLLQKYEGRALLLTTNACAMHCRFCFRRHFPYEKGHLDFQEALRNLREDTSVKEIILSGGDPLSISNETLTDLISNLDSIPHLKRLRFHTRFPIGIPERIDEDFLSMLAKTRLQTWFVIHVNHPRELDEDIFGSLRSILRLGIPVLSQTVLLKAINDQVEILQELFENLVDQGIAPYYLHQLDKAQGSRHFEVCEEEGLQLMDLLAKRLPGYAVPQYVREVAGMPSKTPISSF